MAEQGLTHDNRQGNAENCDHKTLFKETQAAKESIFRSLNTLELLSNYLNLLALNAKEPQDQDIFQGLERVFLLAVDDLEDLKTKLMEEDDITRLDKKEVTNLQDETWFTSNMLNTLGVILNASADYDEIFKLFDISSLLHIVSREINQASRTLEKIAGQNPKQRQRQ